MKQPSNSYKPLSNALDTYSDNFNSFKKPSLKEQHQPTSILKNGGNDQHYDFNEDSLLQKLENKNSVNQPTKIRQEHQQVNDPNIRNLLGEIDALINRIGNDPTPATFNYQASDNYMVQTGQFGNVGQKSEDYRMNHHQLNDQPQSQSKSAKKQVKIVLSENQKKKQESSDESSEKKPKKKKKHRKKHHSKKKSSRRHQSSSSSSHSSDSYISQSKSQHSYRSNNSKSPYKTNQLQQFQQPYNANNFIPSDDNCSKLSYRQYSQRQEKENSQLGESHLREKLEMMNFQQKASEVFCMVCEEFIHEDKVNEHCKFCSASSNRVEIRKNNTTLQNEDNRVSNITLTESQNNLHGINEKLIKINYILTRKIKLFSDSMLIQCGQIIEGCCNKVILTNDSLDQLSRFLADLNIIQTQINNVNEAVDDNFASSLHTLQIIAQKIIQFSMRKFEIIQQLMLTNTQLKLSIYNSPGITTPVSGQRSVVMQQMVPQMASQIASVQSGVVQQKFEGNQIQNNFKQSSSQQQFSNQQQGMPQQRVLESDKDINRRTQKFQDEGGRRGVELRATKAELPQVVEVEQKGVKKKRLFEMGGNRPPVRMHLMSDQIVNANKARRVDEAKENEVQQKKSDNLAQEDEYSYNRKVAKEKMVSQESSKKKSSLVSGISGFLSKISIIVSSQPVVAKSEESKKKFFDLAVRKKNMLHCEHPAQSMLIAELYDRCCNDRVDEKDWDDWLDTMYQLSV